MKVGVLALQGGFRPHMAMLAELGHEPFEVRTLEELDRAEGLVLSGGESTAQHKLLEDAGLLAPLKGALSEKPALVTCAGLILAAQWARLDAEVARNAYGAQTESFEAVSDGGAPLVFIRAPRIRRVGPSVEVLDTLNGEAVRVRSGRLVATTDHPELTPDSTIHALAFGAAPDALRVAASAGG